MFIINQAFKKTSTAKKIFLKIEPFVVQLETTVESVEQSIDRLYADYLLLQESPDLFVDFYITIKKPSGIRSLFNAQVQSYVDGKTPFKPLPYSQAYPFFEWSLNWVVAAQVHNYLIIHAAVVEKEGHVLILCGKPGAGKSTLCAALCNRGWRLFSDEMAIVDLGSNEIIPFVRPVSLKNKSIDLIKQFAPDCTMGMSFADTAKGTVSHMKPNKESVAQATLRANAKWVVFPRYRESSETNLTTISKGETVIELAKNSFNYNVLGAQGFESLCALVERSQCYSFEYSNLEEAVSLFSDLANDL